MQVIREHPRQANLLFVGTEFGVYFTIDGGGHWTQLKGGIPGVPVHDIQIQSRWNDLVVGTHGRGIYILDDLAPLEHLAQAKQAQVAFMFPIRDELEFQPNATRSSGMGTSGFTGQNPELGARIAYVLNDIPADAKATISIVDASGTVIRQMAANNKPGMFRQYWDMRVGPPLTGVVTDTLPPGTVPPAEVAADVRGRRRWRRARAAAAAATHCSRRSRARTRRDSRLRHRRDRRRCSSSPSRCARTRWSTSRNRS